MTFFSGQGPQGVNRDGHVAGRHGGGEDDFTLDRPPGLQPPQERQRLHAPEAEQTRAVQQQHQEDQIGHEVSHGRDEVQRVRMGHDQVPRRYWLTVETPVEELGWGGRNLAGKRRLSRLFGWENWMRECP